MSERQQIQDAVQEKCGSIARARGAVGCASAFIRAQKPAPVRCWGTDCCN